MKRLNFLLLICLWTPVTAWALEMGDIDVHSYLNEPLRATIPINNIDTGFVEDIKIGLADAASYRQLGLDRPAYLTRLNFILKQGDNNQHLLQISSRDRIREPIMDILIKVSGRQNIVMRLYTLMLEFDYPEPVINDVAASTSDQKPAITVQSIAQEPTVSITEVPQKSGTKPVSDPTTTPPVSDSTTIEDAPGNWKVEEGNTILVGDRSLSILAQDSPLHPEYSVYQIMRGFYLLNQDAFLEGNINKLVSGSRLEIPQPSLIAELNRQQSINFVYGVSRDQTTKPGLIADSETSNKDQTIEKTIPPLIGQSFGSSPNMQIPLPMPASLESKRLKELEQKLQQLERALTEQEQTIVTQSSRLQTMNKQLLKKEEVIDHLNVRVQQVESMPAVTTIDSKDDKSSPVAESSVNANVSEPQDLAAGQTDSAGQTINTTKLDQLIAHSREQLQASAALEPAVTESTGQNISSSENSSSPSGNKKTIPIPEIVTIDQSPDQGLSTLFIWLIGSMVVVFSVALVGYEFWRRKNAEVASTKNQSRGESSRSSNSRKMNFEDTYQVKAMNTGVSDRRKAERESDIGMDDTMQAEIDMLIQYGEYEEASKLLEQAREYFPDDDWLDIMELNILGHTRDYAKFFSRFDQYKQHLMHQHPHAWEEILKLSATLSAEMQRPAQA